MRRLRMRVEAGGGRGRRERGKARAGDGEVKLKLMHRTGARICGEHYVRARALKGSFSRESRPVVRSLESFSTDDDDDDDGIDYRGACVSSFAMRSRDLVLKQRACGG